MKRGIRLQDMSVYLNPSSVLWRSRPLDKNAIGRRFADSNHVLVVLSQRLSTVSVGSFVKFSSFELIIQATPLFICSSNF